MRWYKLIIYRKILVDALRIGLLTSDGVVDDTIIASFPTKATIFQHKFVVVKWNQINPKKEKSLELLGL